MMGTLLKFAKPHKLPLALSLLCRVLNQLGTISILIVSGWYAQQLFDGYSPPLWSQLMWPLLWIGIGKAFCRYIEQLSGHNAAFRIQEDFRNRVYWQLEQQAPDNISELSSGELTARVVSDIERVEVFYAHTIVPVLSAAIVSSFVVGYGFLIAGALPALTLLALLIVVGVIVPWLHLSRTGKVGHSIRTQFGEMNTTLTDIVQGVTEIQNWQGMAHFKQRIAKQGRELQRQHSMLAKRNGTKDAITDLLISLGFVLLVASIYWQGEMFSWFSLPILCLYAGAFGPVLALTRTFEDLPQTLPACRRVFALLVTEGIRPTREEEQVINDVNDTDLLSTLELGHQYANSDEAVFEQISVTLNKGQYVLIQGESGGGKTTLLHFLAGVMISAKQNVLYNSIPITAQNRHLIWQQSSYVPQQAVIFPTSLRHNLCLGKNITDNELRRVLQLVCLDTLLANLEEDLDTVLGIHGARVSGGEAQRIALARAVLRDTQIYLLDEAFGALDKDTEVLIRNRLSQWWQNKLVIEVSHQPNGLQEHSHLWQLTDGYLVKKQAFNTRLCCKKISQDSEVSSVFSDLVTQ